MTSKKATGAKKNPVSPKRTIVIEAVKGSKSPANPIYDLLKSPKHSFTSENIKVLFDRLDRSRVNGLADALADYIKINLPRAVDRRRGLSDYRTNPYVLMTTASLLQLGEPEPFARFLFHNKLYMGLETSFGKSIENELVKFYPVNSDIASRWKDAPEKVAEQSALKGLSLQDKARKRVSSVWREIDKSCVIGSKRFLTSIKSGPNCINDTQVAGMARAISENYRIWLKSTTQTYPSVTKLDIVIGLTYGTDRTTNNKENQILVKLLENGFIEESRSLAPGVLIDAATRSVRVYRRIGRDFWSMIGNPVVPEECSQVFLEILIGLARALSKGLKQADVETKMNLRMSALGDALKNMIFPAESIPTWIRDEMSDPEQFWFHTAMSAFYDEGI